MDTISGIKFDHVGIATVLKRERLKVPLNQREYSWESHHVEALFRDIADADADGKPFYFLGTIVLNAATESMPEIVDGQQRLATTTILLAAMRDYMLQKGDEPFAKSIEDDFLFRFDRLSRDYVSTLTLNVDDDAYFKQRVLSRPTDDIRKKCPDPTLMSHINIDNAACLAEARVHTIVQGHSKPEHRLNAWIEFLSKRVIVITLRAPSSMDAFRMFETLNDRGLPTTQADMLKNYLFEQVKDAVPEAQQKWSKMRTCLESLGIDDVALTYLRHVTLAMYGPTTEKTGFYERLQRDVQGKSKSLMFLENLAQYADDYAAILTPTHSKWNSYPGKVRESLTTMRDFGVAQIRPLMLAVARHFAPKETDEAFRAFVCWTVRFLIVGGMRGQGLEDAYAEQSREVTAGKVTSVGELRKNMSDVLPNDRKFEDAFSEASVSKTQLARYYLRALDATVSRETDYPEVRPSEDTDVLNLEHILPETLGPEWSHVEAEVAQAYWKRLGNMVLMSAKKNAAIGNAGFARKRGAFADSLIALTKKVYTTTKADTKWGPVHIKDRQARLAKIAVKTWPL